MKKILIISEPFYPQVAAIGQLLADLSEDLIKAGYQVKVVTGNPKYTCGKNSKISRKEIYKGIEIIRLCNTVFSKYRLTGRVLNYLTFHFFVFFQVLFHEKPDLVFVLSTPPFISFSGLILKVFKRSKVIYNVQDLFPDLAVELGELKNKSFIGFLKKLSELIIGKVDKVIVVGEYMEKKIRKELLRRTKVSVGACASTSANEHIITIHNWADGDKIKVLEDKEAENNYLKEKWELEGKFIVLYSGNIGYLHEFDTVIAAAESLTKEGTREIVFVFIGEGIKKGYIEEKIKEKGLNNILFFTYQPREMLTYSLGLADVSLVTLEKGFEGMVVPSKIYGILASGKPVIAVVGGESEVTEIIKKGECGRVVKIGDYQALADSIMNYYKDRKKCRVDGLNGRRFFEKKFERKIATRKYIKVIKEVLKS